MLSVLWERVCVWVSELELSVGMGLTLCMLCMGAGAIRLDQIEIQIARLRVGRPPRRGKSPHIGQDTAEAFPPPSCSCSCCCCCCWALPIPTATATVAASAAEQLGDTADKVKI